MRLSVITICYNIKDEIQRTCESIKSQTNQDFEWIVVDGGSTDGTVDILNKYKSYMTVFISEPDKGIYNAMNKGIKLAKGEYLNFMNGGDCFASSDVVEKFYKCPALGADVIYGNVNIIDENGNRTFANIPASVDKLYFYNGYTINHQASFIKRELFTQYGLYNEDYKIVSDWEKWIIFIINNCRFQYWHETIGNFYLGGISSVNLKLHRKEVDEVCAKYYTQDEVIQATKHNNFHTKKYNIKILGFIPFLTIKYKPLSYKISCKLFKYVPLIKIINKPTSQKVYLFGFLQLWKIKKEK